MQDLSMYVGVSVLVILGWFVLFWSMGWQDSKKAELAGSIAITVVLVILVLDLLGY
jgi:hypothetical protein